MELQMTKHEPVKAAKLDFCPALVLFLAVHLSYSFLFLKPNLGAAPLSRFLLDHCGSNNDYARIPPFSDASYCINRS